jgi:3-oxoadipate enol-lactonase
MLIRADGRNQYYDLCGPESGPVVCMAHSLSADSGIWAEQLPPLLAAGLRVLRIDMRGHGGSDPGQANCNMAALADDVARVLDFLGLDRVHLVGLSIGGMIAQAFAVSHGQRLRSLFLSGTAPERLAGGAALWQPRFDAIARSGSVEPLADGTMTRWFTDAFKLARPGRWQQIRSTIAATSPAGYVAGATAIIDFDITAQLPAVRVPTLVVCGSDDTGTPPAGARKIATLIPGARYEELPVARHVPNVEYPDRFNRLLLDWLGAQP